MHKQCITLAVLMVPTFGYGKSNEVRIQELRKAQYHKRLEISDLAERISKSDDFINSCRVKYQLYLQLALQKKFATPANEVELSKQIAEINNALINDVRSVLRGEKSLDKSLAKELFDQKNPNMIDAFESLKFLFIRGVTERDLLEALVASYEARIVELSAINKELLSLEN